MQQPVYIYIYIVTSHWNTVRAASIVTSHWNTVHAASIVTSHWNIMHAASIVTSHWNIMHAASIVTSHWNIMHAASIVMSHWNTVHAASTVSGDHLSGIMNSGFWTPLKPPDTDCDEKDASCDYSTYIITDLCIIHIWELAHALLIKLLA